MPELTDDQLDGLFRKSDEEFDPPFDPAAWQNMQSRLDKHDRTKPAPVPVGKKPLRWGLFMGLLLLGVGWYAYHYRPSAETRTERVPNPTQEVATPVTAPPAGKADRRVPPQPAHPSTLETAGHSPAAVDRPGPTSQPAGPVARVGKAESPLDRTLNPETPVALSEPEHPTNPSGPVGTSARKVERERTGHRSPKASVLAGTAVKPYQKAGGRSSKRNLQTDRLGGIAGYADPPDASAGISAALPLRKRRSNAESAPAAQLVTSETAEPLVSASGPETAQPVRLQPTLAELANQPLRWPDPLTLAPPTVTARPDTVKRVTGQMAYQRGLSIRLAVAPDLSGIGLTNFSRPGTNLGVLLEYRLAPRWSFQAGVIRSVKVYTASTTKYEWGGMNWPVQPESVGGRCNMLDIPINVRYDFALRPRPGRQFPSRWFVSGGVTSYYMLREDYTYKYANPRDPAIKYWRWPIEKGTGGYGFSQLNVSAGYERGFTRRLSWQVEPFLKVPLKGVGYYKLDLLSTGAFFSLRYKL